MDKLWKRKDFEPYSEEDTKAEWDEWQKKAIKLWEHEDVEPYSEAEAKAEWDEWQKQAIMDDKAQ